MGYMRQCGGVFNHGRNIHHPPDVGATVTNKHTNPGRLFRDISFFGIYSDLVQLPATVGKDLTAKGIRPRSPSYDRFGNVYGTLKGTAYKNTGPRGLNGI